MAWNGLASRNTSREVRGKLSDTCSFCELELTTTLLQLDECQPMPW